MPFFPIQKSEGIMTHSTSSMDLMGTIDLNRDIRTRIFSGVLTSIRFLRRWPGPLDSEALRTSSKSRMARDTVPLNFKDREPLERGSCFSVPVSEETNRKEFLSPLTCSRDILVNSLSTS